MNFIEELYYGNISPSKKCFDQNTTYAAALNNFCQKEEMLTTQLTGKNLKAFTSLINSVDEMTALSDLENFKAGFKLGAKKMCDVLLSEVEIFHDLN